MQCPLYNYSGSTVIRVGCSVCFSILMNRYELFYQMMKTNFFFLNFVDKKLKTLFSVKLWVDYFILVFWYKYPLTHLLTLLSSCCFALVTVVSLYLSLSLNHTQLPFWKSVRWGSYFKAAINISVGKCLPIVISPVCD